MSAVSRNYSSLPVRSSQAGSSSSGQPVHHHTSASPFQPKQQPANEAMTVRDVPQACQQKRTFPRNNTNAGENTKSRAVLEYERKTMSFARSLFLECTSANQTQVLTIEEFEEFIKMVFLHLEFRGKKLKAMVVEDLTKSILTVVRHHQFEFKTTGIYWKNVAMLLESLLESILLVRSRLFERSDEMAPDICELMDD